MQVDSLIFESPVQASRENFANDELFLFKLKYIDLFREVKKVAKSMVFDESMKNLSLSWYTDPLLENFGVKFIPLFGTDRKLYRVSNPGNYFDGLMSPFCMGVAFSILATCRLAERFLSIPGCDETLVTDFIDLNERYRDYASHTTVSKEIIRFID